MAVNKTVERIHLVRAFFWIPATIFVFAMGWHHDTRKLVIVTLVYSAYANLESGYSTYQGRRSERKASKLSRDSCQCK